jgi:hypothetical protein
MGDRGGIREEPYADAVADSDAMSDLRVLERAAASRSRRPQGAELGDRRQPITPAQ